MTALRLLSPFLLTLGLTSACGGSSSETPPPLPPTPLNEPYRAKSAVEPRPEPLKPGVEAEAEAEPEPAPNPQRGPKSKGSGTWGSNAPEPLPELSPK